LFRWTKQNNPGEDKTFIEKIKRLWRTKYGSGEDNSPWRRQNGLKEDETFPINRPGDDRTARRKQNARREDITVL
jgi:hypothetical protein